MTADLITAGALPSTAPYDVERVRADFPILARQVNGVPLVYLDSAATSQKPRQVLAALDDYYERHNANVHRGIHTLAEEATAAYEGARDTVAAYVNAYDRTEIVFTKNSTEAINLVAYAFSNVADGFRDPRFAVGPGDEICVTEMEHHSNLVPWQLLCMRTGATLRWIGLTDEGRLDYSNLDEVINERTRIVAVVHQSNMLGTINSVSPIVERAHAFGALVLLDASQSAAHGGLDVREDDVDFAVFTGHKMLGPTGIGALWAKRDLLDAMPPFMGGGEMIETVSMDGVTFAPAPHKFEAGTPPIAQAVALGAAVDYLTALGPQLIKAHERSLTAHTLEQLADIDGLRVIGPTSTISRGGAVSFVLEGIHSHDVGQVLDSYGIAVRVGHHCARPACLRYGVLATTRASFHAYTTHAEIDALVDGIRRVQKFFS